MTMQAIPITTKVRNGEPQALRTGLRKSPATTIGTVAKTIHTANRKFQSPKIATPGGIDGAEHEPANIRPEIADDGRKGCDLHRRRKCRSGILPAEQSWNNAHMRRR